MEENFVLDDNILQENMNPVEEVVSKKKTAKKAATETNENNDQPLINCLKDERVIVRFIKKAHPLIKDPNHIASGGLMEGCNNTFSLPMLSSGSFKNCLTNNEKRYLEHALGLEDNALSVYKKIDNFWESGSGNAEITLSKDDTYLNLAKPNEYIIYKMLLANTDQICPSLKELHNNPKATYKYVIINENDEAKLADDEMNVTSRCYLAFGKYQDDADTLRTIIEIMENKELSDNTKIEFLRQQINNEIKLNPKLFLSVITDDYIDAKVVIKRAVKNGIISKRGAFYYKTDDNQALCESHEDPTLDNAARFLTNPKRNDMYLKIQAKLNPKQ